MDSGTIYERNEVFKMGSKVEKIFKPAEMTISDISKLLFGTTSEGLVVVDQFGYIQLVNPSLENMFGYDSADLIDNKIELLIPDIYEEKHTVYKHDFKNSEKRPTLGIEMEITGKRKNGEVFPIEISLNHFEYDGRDMIMALISDRTDKERLNNVIKREREKEQVYLDVTRTFFVLIDENGKITMINRRGCEVLGYNEEELIGNNWFDFFHTKQEEKEVQKDFQRMFKGQKGDVRFYQHSIKTKKGKDRLIAWNYTTIKTEDGKVNILGSGEDITDQSRAEEKLVKLNVELERRIDERTKALKESHRLYKLIARNFPSGVINVFDRDLNYVFVEGMEMYKKGITGDMLVGKSFLARIDPEIREEIKEKMMSVFEGGHTSFEIKKKDSTFLINAVGLPDSNYKINQVLMVSQNITDQKKAQEEIQRLLEKEKHLNELKSRFVSMASHEFRTPLTAVMNSISLLTKFVGTEENGEKQYKHLDRIKTSVHNLTNILNDFLSLDKLEEGKIQLSKDEIDVAKFSGDVIDNIELIAKNGQKIKYSHVGPEMITIDKQMLKNICNNLLTNAVKYSSEHSPIFFETRNGEEEFTVVVRDEGIGIPEDEQEHLFERFFRAKNALNIQGTGLGLNIIKKYMEIVNGQIDFISEYGNGTEFMVRIPKQKEVKEK